MDSEKENNMTNESRELTRKHERIANEARALTLVSTHTTNPCA